MPKKYILNHDLPTHKEGAIWRKEGNKIWSGDEYAVEFYLYQISNFSFWFTEVEESPEETITRLTKEVEDLKERENDTHEFYQDRVEKLEQENEELKKELADKTMTGGAKSMPLAIGASGGYIYCDVCGGRYPSNSYHGCSAGSKTIC